ncbi:MAG: LysR substrate-binding domain-containing protein [Campylobacterales bacterium]
MNTFLTVARERSFSKASAKIGISQPAVTQQIKCIEDYLQCKVIERRKNGVVLTKEGEALYKIVGRLEKSLEEGERELLKIVRKEIPLVLAACPVAGNYLLPCCINDLKRSMEGDVSVAVERTSQMASLLKSRQADVAVYSPSSFEEEIVYKEWIDDEIVMFSNQPLPPVVGPEEMARYQWIGRDENSQTRKIAQSALKGAGLDCERLFDMRSVFNDATAIKQAVLKSPKDPEAPMASIISRFAILDEVGAGLLHQARIKGCSINRKLYLAYLKERKGEAAVNRAVKFLSDKRALALSV